MSHQPSVFPPLHARTSRKAKEEILPQAGAACVSEAMKVNNARAEAPLLPLDKQKQRKINKTRCERIAYHRNLLAAIAARLPETKDKLQRIHALMSHPALNGEYVDTVSLVYAAAYGYTRKAYERAFRRFQTRLIHCIELHSN